MLDKIGYLILLFIYTFGFSIGKGLFNEMDMPSKLQRYSTESIVHSMANELMDSIGMNNFFDELTNGL